ncbi:MAG: PGF-pre-PGF domain-containing protein, partial [Natronomonas sp.]
DLSATVDDIAVSDGVDVSGAENDSNTGGDDGDSVDDGGDGDDGDSVDDGSGGSGGGADTGGGGGGGGGGAPTQPSEDDETQDPAANITVTDTTLSTTDPAIGESVTLTVTVENEGEAAGERNVSILVDGEPITTETVALDAGESGTVSATISFETAGEQEVSVGGVTVGTVVVTDDDSENETSGDGPDVEPPAGAVAFDARGIDDAAPGQAGVAVDFENVTVERITFIEGADGQVTITEMDELPDGVPETPGSLLSVMEITVPENISEAEATIRFTLNESELDAVGSDPESVRLGHYTDGDWDIHQPELVDTEDGELVYESEVPGFSLYAVYAEESTDPAATDAPETEGSVNEEAGLIDSPVTVVLGLVGLIALVVSIAGARMYQQNDRL